MSLLKRYLKARGIKTTDLAKAIGMNHHRVYKTIDQYREPAMSNPRKHRSPVVRQAISDYLGLAYQEVWDELSDYTLRLLIGVEIERLVKKRRAELIRAYLSDAGKGYQGEDLPAMTKWRKSLEEMA